jgi:hypothetical protein
MHAVVIRSFGEPEVLELAEAHRRLAKGGLRGRLVLVA